MLHINILALLHDDSSQYRGVQEPTDDRRSTTIPDQQFNQDIFTLFKLLTTLPSLPAPGAD